jgi:hypothetical protein
LDLVEYVYFPLTFHSSIADSDIAFTNLKKIGGWGHGSNGRTPAYPGQALSSNQVLPQKKREREREKIGNGKE